LSHGAADTDYLAKLNLALLVWLEAIFTAAPGASRNDALFKSGQKRLKFFSYFISLKL